MVGKIDEKIETCQLSISPKLIEAEILLQQIQKVYKLLLLKASYLLI